MNILDVPFHSSGAINRSHYAIVRRVETATSIPTADQQIFLEIKAVQEKLHLGLSTDRCKECLIILLYCATAVSPGFLPRDALEFAFRHAINLAEAGRTIEDKRIGYLFCSEMMPMDHELRLMLVNTLRKDLESNSVARICMALDNLIVSPSTTVVPIAQPLLHDLLSHYNPHVKKRALFALRALSEFEPALFHCIQNTIIDQLGDDDDSVVNATLALLSDHPPQDISTHSRARNKTNEILKIRFSGIYSPNAGLILHCLRAIRSLGLGDSTIPLLHEMIQKYSQPNASKPLSRAVILEVFKTLGQLDSDIFTSAEAVASISSVHSIKHFSTSGITNDIYLFISCLECIDATNWAGTSPNRPPVLQAEDFDRILQQLHSQDQGISRKTMRVIRNVDPSLLDMQLSLLSQISSKGTIGSMDIDTCLDIILIRHDEDGEKYAEHIVELAENVDKVASRLRVSRKIVERVLTDIRTSQNIRFKKSAIVRFVQVLIQPNAPLSPTALVFSSALTTEFLGSLPFTPEEILNGMACRLKTCAAIVQEPLLVTMLHVSAHCNEISPEVVKVVEDMSKTAVRPVQDCCIQFIAYSQKKEELVQISLQSASSSVSDFLTSLQNHVLGGAMGSSTTNLQPPFWSTPQDSSTSSRAGSPRIMTGPPLIDLQIGPLVGAEDRADFRNIWTSMEGQCDMRGWSKNSIPTITRLLEQFTAGLQLKVVPAGVHTYEGEIDLLILSRKKTDDMHGVEAALRLQESEDSSCLWRLRCADVLLGTKVQWTLDRD